MATNGSHVSLQRVAVVISGPSVPKGIVFLVRENKADRWFKDLGGANFYLPLPTHKYWTALKALEEKRRQVEKERQERRAKEMAERYNEAVKLFEAGKAEREQLGTLSYRCVTLSDNIGYLDAYVYPNEATTEVYVHFTACTRVPCVLHWGVLDVMGTAQTQTESRWVTWQKEGLSMEELEKKREEEIRKRMARRGAPSQWICPPPGMRPEGTVLVDPVRAVQTPFEEGRSQRADLKAGSSRDKVLHQLTIRVPAHKCPRISEDDPGVDTLYDGIACCLKEVNGQRWFRSSDGCDIQIRLVDFGGSVYKGLNAEMVQKIVEAEVEWQHMTLMHRYNLMRSLLEGFNANHATSLEANSSFQALEERQRALAKDWTERHYASPELRLPLTFASSTSSGGAPAVEAPRLTAAGAAAVEEEGDFWAWFFVWGRFAFLGLLDWQRNYNTKPRELAWASEQLTCATARAWRMYPKYRPYIRESLSTMGRGGAQGQAIRDRILDIMHKHKIPEAAGNFYEQWHQKLHNNTTPDDVGICEAIIGYLESNGNMNTYWRILQEHNITRERLASYERKITQEPYMVHANIGDLVNDFRAYLSILKDVHDALDIKKAFDYARQYLPQDAIGLVEGVVRELASQRQQRQQLSASDAFSRFERLAEARKKVFFTLNQGGGLGDDGHSVAMTRELLFLDCALEQQENVLLQGTSATLDLPQLAVVLRELLLSVSALAPVDRELRSMYADWAHLGDSLASCIASNGSCASVCDGREAALLLKALTDRVVRFVGSRIDAVQAELGSKAVYLGNQVGTEKKVLDVFVDEVLRGSALFSLSLVIKRLEPILRKAAMLPPWQLISIVEKVQGELVSIEHLKNIQDKVFETPTVLLCGAVSGEEEIPIGVQAVLVRSAAVAPDILSHVAVRARNAHVLVAVCFEPTVADNLETFNQQWVCIKCAKDGSGLEVHEAPRPSPALARRASKLFNRKTTQELFTEASLLGRRASFIEERSASARSLSSCGSDEGKRELSGTHAPDAEADDDVDDVMQLKKVSKEWCIPMDSFNKTVVGSKSNNIKKLSDVLDPSVLTPRSVALPFGCMQKTLSDAANRSLLPELMEVLVQLSPSSRSEEADAIFARAKAILARVELPGALLEGLQAAMRREDEAKAQKSRAASAEEDARLRALGTRPSLFQLWETSGSQRCADAVKAVWQSLFGLRPWVSLTKAGRNYSELNMAVLVQELMPAHCAFVLHSRNPFSDNKDEMYGELALGLGEVIVGNFAGRSLGWRMKRGGEPVVVAFPSKSEYLLCDPCLIFRSDSNGEDLENFAGAGLFESVPAFENRAEPVTYWNTRVINDRDYRMRLLKRIGELAFTVEDKYGLPQDIEGVVVGWDTVALVQTRTQV
ncbi:putative alpha-glucan water dikinase 1 [Besnoitia besnoiti]|uniref:Putative alpha-glucan water dikinase 1 n=1 Tax=Besnoitia besnoiti TaxID=94643 RepID=A0A2A9MIU2_BESBE|nr:putative alpha-glucan water dikinase 1 [Besnoitia besnoiti]PFH37114.1 putative alpha-glucan water dikinase 1 [Besnoitia besnoiti]